MTSAQRANTVGIGSMQALAAFANDFRPPAAGNPPGGGDHPPGTHHHQPGVADITNGILTAYVIPS